MKNNMLKLLNKLLLLTLVGGLFVITSCGDDDDDEFVPTQTVFEIVQSRDDLSTLESVLQNANLDDDLSADGSLTLFAPSNDAMQTLLNTLGLTDFSTISDDIIQAVLTYHVANSQVLAADLAAGNTIGTLQGEQISVAGGPVLSTGATSNAGFVETDLLATNGVVHVVDVVLVPPSIGALIVQTLGTVAQPVLLGADFSILSEGLQLADTYAAQNQLPQLLLLLIDSETKTVFAPTNATFDAAGLTASSFTGEQWYGIIANHVVFGGDNPNTGANGVIDPEELTTGATFQAALGGTLTIFNDTNTIPADNGIGIFIDSDGDVDLQDPATYTNFDAEVAVPNAVAAGNGLIHVIAGVLTP